MKLSELKNLIEEKDKLYKEIADIRKEEPQGVPYIIIGNQSWDGYTSSYDDEIIDKIQSEYEKDTDSRYDVMTYVDSNGIDYNAENVTKEIEGLYDAGAMGGYITWNSGSNLSKKKKPNTTTH